MPRRNSLFAFVSLLLFSALVFAYLWWGRFQYHHDRFLIMTYLAATSLVIVNHWYFRDGRQKLGLVMPSLRASLLWYGLPTLAGIAIISVAGLLWSRPEPPSGREIALYFLWAVLQQHLLQNFLRSRAEDLAAAFSGRWKAMAGVAIAAFLFAAFHLPNAPLFAASLAGALLWCSLFVRLPNLLGASLSQALLVSALLIFFKPGLLNHFEVGLGGHRFHFYGGGVQVAGGYDTNNQPFIATLPGADLGQKAKVRLFAPDGSRLQEWIAFEEWGFSGEIAVGDLGLTSGDEIAVAAGPGYPNPPLVRVFSSSGELLSEFLADWLPPRYGAWISIQCGRLYLCPGPGPHAPQKVFEVTPQGRLLREWEFPQLKFVNSLKAKAICRHSPEDPPLRHDLLLWASPIAVNPSTFHIYDTERNSLESFSTFGTVFGVNAALMKTDASGYGVVAAPGPLRGHPPHILVLGLGGDIVHSFFPFQDDDCHGSNVAALDIDGDSRDEIILGEGIGRGRPARVRVLKTDGTLVASWLAY
jgi:hypothetical protein